MSSSRYTISPLTADDLQVAGDFLHTCKLALPINRLLIKDWPNPAVQKPMYHGAISGSLDNPKIEQLKAVDSTSGKFVGFITFTRNHPEAQTAESAPTTSPPATPPGLDSRVFQAVTSASKDFESAVQSIDHYEVIYVGVRPEYRRRRIASQLLDKVMERAMMDKVSIITVAEPEAHAFFLAKGFEETGKACEWDLAEWASSPKSGFGLFRLAQISWKP